MAIIRADHPEIEVDHPGLHRPKPRHRAKVAMTNQVLESMFFKGQRLLNVTYDATREIVTFHIDMEGIDGFEVVEGQEPKEVDWTIYK